MKSKPFLQILFPFSIIFLIIGFVVFRIVSNETTNLQQAGGVASIYLLFMILLPILISLLATIGLIFLIYNVSSTLKELFPKINRFFKQISESTSKVCSHLTKPFIDLSSYTSIISRKASEKGKNGQKPE